MCECDGDGLFVWFGFVLFDVDYLPWVWIWDWDWPCVIFVVVLLYVLVLFCLVLLECFECFCYVWMDGCVSIERRKGGMGDW